MNQKASKAETQKVASHSEGAQLPKAQLPLWKKLLFSLILTIVFPAIFLVLLETSLKFANVGVPTDFYLSSEENSETVYRSNQYFIRKFFGSGVSRGTMPFIIPEEKPDDTIRIFLLGASAAQGDPDPAYGISQQLETMLQEQFPDHSVEVYNMAITAINSHVVLPILRACLDLKPDLFIVYLGNNEVVGPYGSGSAFSPLVKYRWLIWLQTKVKGSRYGQWINENFKNKSEQPVEWGGMQMFLDQPVPQNDPRMQVVYQHYRNNLRSMFRLAERKSVPLIISSVAVNLKDNAPFASQHSKTLSEPDLKLWQNHYDKGKEKQALQQYDQALDHYTKAIKLDDQYAELHFKIAECYSATGHFNLAKQAYERAKNLDILRFRADSTINQIIEETAAQYDGTHFVDGRKAIESKSPNGIPGREMLYEHVHLNFSGNYEIAKAINPFALSLLKSEKNKQYKTDIIINEEQMQKRLAYTLWDQLKIARFNLERISEPPFTAQSDFESQRMYLVSKINQISSSFSEADLERVLATYEYALSNYPNWFLYDHIADVHMNLTGHTDLAVQFLEKSIEAYPHYSDSFDQLALTKLKIGQLKEAEVLFRKSLTAEPTIARKKINLGVVIGLQGRHDEAIELLRAVVEQDQYIEDAYFNLALNFFNKNPDSPTLRKEALRYWKIVVEKNPNQIEARYGIANIYLRESKLTEATLELERILSLDPQHQRSLVTLNQIKAATNKRPTK